MNLTTMRRILSDRVPIYSVESNSTELDDLINQAYQELGGAWTWPSINTFDIIQTVIDVTTGTISISSGATTATLSASQATSMTNRFIQFQGTDDWYEITAHTAASDTLTIDPPYAPTSALSSGTYKIRKLFYAANSEIDNIKDMKRSQPGIRKLNSLSERSGDFMLSLRDSDGDPRAYIMNNNVSTPTFSLYPSPSSVLNLYITGTKTITNLSTGSDIPVFPAKYHTVILDLATFYGMELADDTRAKDYFTKYLNGLENMKRLHRHDLGKINIMASIDDYHGDIFGPIFPDEYGLPGYGFWNY